MINQLKYVAKLVHTLMNLMLTTHEYDSTLGL